MVRADPLGAPHEKRFTLRLWASDAVLQDGTDDTCPVLVGTVMEERLRRPLGLLTLTMARPAANGPRDILAAALDHPLRVRRALAAPDEVWDGHVILASDPDLPDSAPCQGADSSVNEAPSTRFAMFLQPEFG
jgi:undecaprenyl-diphosphatase